MRNVRVAVVVPCYNTSAACVDVIVRARAAADALLVVDDGSTDDTPEHIRSTGEITGGPRPFATSDRSRFLQALDEAVNRERRKRR